VTNGLHSAWLMVASTALLSACASPNETTSQNRAFPTGIDTSETVAVLVMSYEPCRPEQHLITGASLESICRESGRESAQDEFENCLTDAMKRERPGIKTSASSNFLRETVAGMNINEMPADVEAFLKRFRDGPTTNGTPRYVVIVKVTTRETHSRYRTEAVSPVVGVTKETHRYTSLLAHVVDLKEGRLAGTVHSEASGIRKAGVFLVFLIVPIPVADGGSTEKTACRALGKALVQFIANPDG